MILRDFDPIARIDERRVGARGYSDLAENLCRRGNPGPVRFLLRGLGVMATEILAHHESKQIETGLILRRVSGQFERA